MRTAEVQVQYSLLLVCLPGILDIPMISWVVMLVSRLLDYVASIEDEASGGKKNLGGKERDKSASGISWNYEPKLNGLWQLDMLMF